MRKKRAGTGLLFLVPGLLGFTFFILIPVFYTMYYAAADVNGNFILFENLLRCFQSEAFLLALRNTGGYLTAGSLLTCVAAVILAMVILRVSAIFPKWVTAVRTSFLVPMVIPSSVCVMFVHMLFSDNGMLSRLSGKEIDYLQTAPYTFWILIGIYLYKNAGYYTMIFLLAFAGIPQEIYDAAKCDGAGVFHKLFRIMLPQIIPSLFFLLIMCIVNVFKMSRESYLLFGDYPNTSAYMYQNFVKNNLSNLSYSRAATASLVLMVLFAGLVIVMIRISDKGDFTYE